MVTVTGAGGEMSLYGAFFDLLASFFFFFF